MAKRRSTAKKKEKKQSPYVKYGKTPFRYSETYYQWREASKRGERDKSANLARKHTAQFMRTVFAEAA